MESLFRDVEKSSLEYSIKTTIEVQIVGEGVAWFEG